METEIENDTDVLINTLLSLKHVLASFHDTVDNQIILLEEIEALKSGIIEEHNNNHGCNCGDNKPLGKESKNYNHKPSTQTYTLKDVFDAAKLKSNSF